MLTRTPAAAGPDDTQFARRVALLALGSFNLGLDAYVMAGLLPSITTEFSVALPIAGQVVTVFTVCYAVAAPLFATLLPGIRASVVLGIAWQCSAPETQPVPWRRRCPCCWRPGP